MSSISLDFSKLSQPEIYKLLVGAIVPRPIAWVSTCNSQGVGNLAPFSFFNAVSSDPPCLMISIARKPKGDKKDTLKNIEETGQFVVNLVSTSLAQVMNQSAADYPYGVDEMKQLGLTPEPSLKIQPPRVKESCVQMECETYQTLEIGNGQTPGSTTVVIGKILAMHVSELAYRDGKIITEALQPLARMAGAQYAKPGEIFTLERPQAHSSDRK
jgi:flavin reductase (DIM6/NTAB) family NADH-FMN oxidoreductase RutF